MRTDQLDPSLFQPQTQGVAVGRLVVDEPSRLRPRKARAGSRDGYLLERRLDERDFRFERLAATKNPMSQRDDLLNVDPAILEGRIHGRISRLL